MQIIKRLDTTSTGVCLILAVLTYISYREALDFGYVHLDDQLYVAHNEMVLSGLNRESLRWAFSMDAVHETANWHPLTWLSLMTDAHFFGGEPESFHRTNIVLHGVNSVLVFLLLVRMTSSRGRSAIVALIFALHPIHVESVAWISERKDVLSTWFGLLALHAYVAHVQSPSGRCSWYAACLLAALGSLLCKPMLVTLPILLLLLDHWPLRRASVTPDAADSFSRLPCRLDWVPDSMRGIRTWLVMEKIPFAILSVVFSVVAMCSQSAGKALASSDVLPLSTRVGNSFIAYGNYLSKSIFPTDLAVFYPYPINDIAVLNMVVWFLIICGISALVTRYRRSSPFLMTGWLWFIVSLVPVIGLVQIGEQQMADRYMYIPLIGLSVMAAWLPSRLPASNPRLILYACFLTGYVVFLVASCQSQVALWKDSERLFRHATEVTSHNAVAFDCLGDAYAERGEHSSAIACYRQSLGIKSTEHSTRFALSRSLAELGNLQAAFSNCSIAVRQSPETSRYHVLLGQLASRLGDGNLAIVTLRNAIQLEPDSSIAHKALGEAYGQCGQFDVALVHFTKAVSLSPEDAHARNSIGFVLRTLGRLEEAEQQLRISLSLDPSSPVTHANLGLLLAATGRRDDAIRHLREALRIQPAFPQAQHELDQLLADER